MEGALPPETPLKEGYCSLGHARPSAGAPRRNPLEGTRLEGAPRPVSGVLGQGLAAPERSALRGRGLLLNWRPVQAALGREPLERGSLPAGDALRTSAGARVTGRRGRQAWLVPLESPPSNQEEKSSGGG
ncbi:hypothetical protein NDU88_007210 [Pleurodeles waltl]|uniref:Uncharacterized protein n=1 Tax=Pleurodeles waltl TaxID=8319 RepID=A0AAV7NU71_PLEWA|nr:hypothetical protein NDU88_007210 [Pleurodeles waltl]